MPPRASSSLALIAALLAGCATGRTADVSEIAVRPLGTDVRQYLLDPTTGIEDIPSTSRSAAQRVYDPLAQGDLGAARRALSGIGEIDVGLRRLLEAQVAFAEGRLPEARAVLGEEPPGDGGLLLSGRLHDLAGQPVQAVQAYWPLRDRLPVARDRIRELLPAALTQRETDFESALANGAHDRAARVLEDLELWASDREPTRRAAVRLAQATEDSEAELTAWRRLARVAPPSREELFDWAELELAHGSADQALEISRALASGPEADERARELLARAEFSWRSRLLPDRARAVLESAALTRAELAVALYWFFPQARYAPSREVRIASDILDHPYRDEIEQIVNAGLLDVDAAGHRFRPDLAAMRLTAVMATADLLRDGGAQCARAVLNVDACAIAVACEVMTADQCITGDELSGAEFGEWARRAQERLTRP